MNLLSIIVIILFSIVLIFIYNRKKTNQLKLDELNKQLTTLSEEKTFLETKIKTFETDKNIAEEKIKKFGK